MSNSIENQQEEWQGIIEMYEFFFKEYNSHQSVLDLVRWLAESPYSSRISASISHAILYLSAQETSPRGQWQGVQISCWRDGIYVDFYRNEADGGYARLRRDYAADEIRAAIEAWLWRLEMGNAWE